jgi:glycosyltransferase involved in cell wall biosynthesis/LmbE family N-acetylglucosaminyl deacetylase
MIKKKTKKPVTKTVIKKAVKASKKPTVAVAMIVKNEEVMLARCLESVKGADAIYIADTGSTDSTVEIAKKYTKNVYLDYVWNDDFSGAQNFIKSKVKEDWIFSIDADEFCHDFEEVRRVIEIATQDTVAVKMIAEGGNRLEFMFSRLFRNKKSIYWVQRAHKHLNVPGAGQDIGNIAITFGFSPAHLLDPDRTLRILQKVVEDEGEAAGRNLYYLGREYWYKGKCKEATETLGKYVQISQWPSEQAEAFLIMSQAYSRLGLDDDARYAIIQAININANFKEAIEWMAGISTAENVAQWKRMARTANNRDILWDRSSVEQNTDTIFLAPHNDDESLFGAYTLMRHKPLVVVVTDSYIQSQRGDKGCSAEERRQETIEAMKVVGCPVVFLGIKDTELTEEILRERLKGFNPGTIYIPALQGGNRHHDLINKVALDMFGKNRCEQYCTYTKREFWTTGSWELTPTEQERELKNEMLDCYKSQLKLKTTIPHFAAVRNKSEWLM